MIAPAETFLKIFCGEELLFYRIGRSAGMRLPGAAGTRFLAM